jgi:histidyl-tRNA synthetase
MIRDLVLGAALAGQSKERADYIKLRQKAQFAVPETSLVEAVAGVLAQHGS